MGYLAALEENTQFMGHLSTNWERYVDTMVHCDVVDAGLNSAHAQRDFVYGCLTMSHAGGRNGDPNGIVTWCDRSFETL